MRISFEEQRRRMVTEQLIPRGIADRLVLDAMERVPRHMFVPEDMRDSAYEDCALPIGEGQTISQPYMVAVMTERLDLKGGENVLEIGTGSGYQAAVLAEIAGKVYSIERISPIARQAERTLKELGYGNIEIHVGDGTAGLRSKAPFDGIIVTAGSPSIPEPLISQLKEGGRLVIPIGDVYGQVLTVAKKTRGTLDIDSSIGCVFVPLIGKFGWKK